MTKGEQGRELIYVSDVVSGYIKASITKKAIGEIINLGSGRPYKVKNIAALVAKLTKTEITPKIGRIPYRAGETMHFYCSNKKAKQLIGWKPKVSLIQGLVRTIEWYRDYLKVK